MYAPQVRCYSVKVIKWKDAVSPINYCPYCGKKLPRGLKNQWIEILKKDYFNGSDAEWFKEEIPSD